MTENEDELPDEIGTWRVEFDLKETPYCYVKAKNSDEAIEIAQSLIDYGSSEEVFIRDARFSASRATEE